MLLSGDPFQARRKKADPPWLLLAHRRTGRTRSERGQGEQQAEKNPGYLRYQYRHSDKGPSRTVAPETVCGVRANFCCEIKKRIASDTQTCHKTRSAKGPRIIAIHNSGKGNRRRKSSGYGAERV